MYSNNNQLISTTLLSYRMTLPNEPGEQVYFLYHGVSVILSRFELVVKGVSCQGVLCDRAQESQANVSCGCLFEGDKGSCVGEYTATIPVPVSINGHGKQEVPKCRSLRMTKLFFDNLSAFGSQPDEKIKARFTDVRSKVKEMVDYINEKGGWTLVGWFKKGKVQDASSTQGDKIESATISLHISLLIPTDISLANGTDETFSKMKIEVEDVPAAALTAT